MAVNLIIGIHGIIPSEIPTNADEDMRNLIEKMAKNAGDTIVCRTRSLSWGHQPYGYSRNLRDDQKLTKAQKKIGDEIKYENVNKSKNEHNSIQGDLDLTRNLGLEHTVKENLVLFGLSDVIYYCSSDGEQRIRNTICEQILTAINDANHPVIRLHIVAHSLGAAISHDLLYNVFGIGTGLGPFQNLKNMVENGSLELGSWVTIASQLPLFMMRTQGMVDKFYSGQKLNLSDIGIRRFENRDVNWLNIYERDDLLGFPATNLYEDPDELTWQFQADVGGAAKAHHLTSYIEDKESMSRLYSFINSNFAR